MDSIPHPLFARLPDGLLAPMVPNMIVGMSRDMFRYPGGDGIWAECTPARSGQISYWDHEQQAFFTATYANSQLHKELGIVEYTYEGEPQKGICISESRTFGF